MTDCPRLIEVALPIRAALSSSARQSSDTSRPMCRRSSSTTDFASVQHFLHRLKPTRLAGLIMPNGNMCFDKSGEIAMDVPVSR